MKVTIETLAAIYNIGMSIAAGDGKFTQENVMPLEKFYTSIKGFDTEAMKKVIDCASNNTNLTIERSIELIKVLDADVKLKLANIFADIVRSDEEISENKLQLFNGATNLCGLPAPTTPIVGNEDDVITPTFIIAQTNGFARPFQSEATDWQTLDAELAEQIGAERTEVVRYTAPLNELSKRIGLRGYHLVFLVDRNGYASGAGDNMTGTILYGSGAEIRGNIVFALETDNNYKICGSTSMAQIDGIYNAINDAVGDLLRLE